MVVIMARWTMASWWSGSGLVVARAAAVLVDPRETSLDHPNAGPDVETSGAGDAFDDLQSKGENVFRPDEQPSGVTAVGPDQRDGGEAAAQSGQESVCGVAVGDRGGGDDDGEQQAVPIHGDVPLDAVRSLGAIPAAAGSGHGVGGGYRLRVDDRRGRAPVPPGPHPQSVAQRVEDALPRPAAGP